MIMEWHNALWGDYDINDLPEGSSGPLSGHPKIQHELQVNIYHLFRKGGLLPSYNEDSCPQFSNTLMTLEMVSSNSSLHCSIAWDAYETNWQCKLLTLDVLMVRLNQWSELNWWI